MSGLSSDRKFTVCVYLTGERPQRALKILDTLLMTPGLNKQWDLIVGIDAISYDLKQFTQREHALSKKMVIIETKASIGKARFMQSMSANIRSHYVLFFDDTVELSKSWSEVINSYIQHVAPEQVAGLFLPSTEISTGTRIHQSALLVKTKFLREIEMSATHSTLFQNATPFTEEISNALGINVSDSNFFDSALLSLRESCIARTAALQEHERVLSACVCTYGDHPDLILRCIDSVLMEPLLTKNMEMLVGCNNVSDRVMREIEHRYGNERITTLVRAPVNFNKSGMQRFTFRLSRAPYILSLDDDMYFKRGWFASMMEFVLRRHPFEAAGRLHHLSNRGWWSGKKKPYQDFVTKKKWWRDKKPLGALVTFPAGQCFLARRAFVLENDYPDLSMKIDWDDVLLGDMVTQLDGRQEGFDDALLARVIIDDIPSRGQHGGG